MAPVNALSVVINAEPILEKLDRGKVKYRLLNNSDRWDFPNGHFYS